MQKLKAFFYIYKKSLTSIRYYLDVTKANGWLAFKYFISLSLIITIILTIKISLVEIPKAKSAVIDIANTVKNMFPDDLFVTFKDNKWSINKPEPFIVTVPSPNTGMPKNLIVFYNTGTIDDLTNLDTLVLVNSKNIIVRDANNFRTYPIGDLPNGEFNKSDFNGFVDELGKVVNILPWLIPVAVFIGSFLYFMLFKGSNLYAFAIPVWLLGMATKLKPTYGETVKIMAHTATLPMTVYAIIKLVGVEIPFIFWFASLNVVFALVVVMRLNRNEDETIGKPNAIPKAEGTSKTESAAELNESLKHPN